MFITAFDIVILTLTVYIFNWKIPHNSSVLFVKERLWSQKVKSSGNRINQNSFFAGNVFQTYFWVKISDLWQITSENDRKLSQCIEFCESKDCYQVPESP